MKLLHWLGIQGHEDDGKILTSASGRAEWADPVTGILSIVEGDGITVDDTDPLNPIVSADAVSASTFRSGRKAGSWQNTSMDFASTGSASGGTVGNLHLQPYIVGAGETLDRIGLATVATGVGTARLGIYNSGSDGLPSTVLLDAGTVSNATSTGEKSITISQALSPGVYWLACLIVTTGGTWRHHDTSPNHRLLGRATIEGSYNTDLRATGVATGSLPSPAPTLATSTSDSPRVAVRVA